MGEFRTKIDLSNNRQAKQRVGTETEWSGSTSFGLPFSALTSGPNEDTTVITESVGGVESTYSGNSGTTIWTFGDSRMSIGASALSAITPSNTGTTQFTDDVFIANNISIIDGNTVNLNYSGVSFDMSIQSISGLGGGNYSGSGYTTSLEIISADTLDFTGRTIWADIPEILRTKKLIVTDGASVGNVLTADAEGMATWQPVSGATGGTTSLELVIGDWDMNITATVNIAHGLSGTEWKTIREIETIVRNDVDTAYYPPPYENGNDLFNEINSTNITLVRSNGLKFDSINFSATSYNRGWVTIKYTSD